MPRFGRSTGIVALLLIALGSLAVGWVARDGGDAGVPLERGEVAVRVSGPGTVQARVPVVLSARVTAQVVAMHADHGDAVRRGQLLAELDDRDLAAKRAAALAAGDAVERNIAAAQANQAKALADLELARSRAGRDLDLHRSGFISQSAYEASALGLRAAQAAADNAAATLAARRAEARSVAQDARYADALWSYTRIVAPMDGVVIQRSAEIGSTVVPGAPLFRLVEPRTLWVAARIDEALVGRLREGMAAEIRLRTGERLAGKVARISRQSDAATRELEVDVAFDSPPERFAIDQEAQVSIAAGTENGLLVPVAALARAKGQEGVYVLRGGKRDFQPLALGASDGRHAVARSGLQPGDRIAPWTSR